MTHTSGNQSSFILSGKPQQPSSVGAAEKRGLGRIVVCLPLLGALCDEVFLFVLGLPPVQVINIIYHMIKDL